MQKCVRLGLLAMLLAAVIGNTQTGYAREAVVLGASLGNKPLSVLYAVPDQPKAVLVMLPGGSGRVGIDSDGHIKHPHNFVVRTRADWQARGYIVVILDSPRGVNLRGYRHTAEYAEMLSYVVEHIQQQWTLPVFLLGTSQGSIAAMNGGAHVKGIAGIVLTESVSVMGHSGETVFSADPQQVGVPALIVANQQDRCWVAPPSQAQNIKAAMTLSPNVDVIHVNGGIEHSKSVCGSLTSHGYYGIEGEVIDDIDHWIVQRLGANAHSSF